LVRDNVISKGLESDELYFFEGQTRDNKPDFISREEFQDDLDDENLIDNMSAGDCEIELNEKIEMIDIKT
jgi:hypothetical protein